MCSSLITAFRCDQHILADHIERQRGVHRVAERVEDGGQVVRDAVGDREGVERRDHQVLGERAGAVDADADRVAAQVAAAGAAVAAVAAGDVAFAGDALADLEALHFRAHAGDDADVLVADVHRHRDGLLRPLIPVPDMDVGAADRGLGDLDQQVVRADLGHRHVGHLQTRRRLQFGKCFHLSTSFLFAAPRG